MIFRSPTLKKSIKLQGERSDALNRMRGRVIILMAFFVVAYAAVAVRAFDLSVMQMRPAKSGEAEYFVTDAEPQADHRGNIYDRNGVLMATTIPVASLFADPKLIFNAEELTQDLIGIFPDLDYGSTLQRLQSDGRFAWIKRNITPDEQTRVLMLGQPGLNFEQETKRFYPHGKLASHLIGYTNIDDHGLAGLERSFDKYLSQGSDLNLTLDVRLQHVLHREVARAMEEFTAKAGVGVIMNAKTGDILAGVSLPDFDPHDAGGADDNSIFNRLTLGVYELGSMFKIFSTAAVLEYNKIPLSYKFDATKPIKIGRHTINDYHAENRILSVPEVFMVSSNIGSAKMGEMVGSEKLQAFYDDLGLLTPLDFEIREVGYPLKPNPWREINTLTASYGHGVATTPLQMSAAVAAIVNGGLLVKPKLVKHEKAEAVDDSAIRVISENTSLKMRALLRLVVTDGTAKNADVVGFEVGGKTGTAEKIVNGRYDRKKLISSLVAAFPASDPEYVVMVMVDEPIGNKKSWGYATAGWVAAPAVARVVDGMAAILGMSPKYIPEEQEVSAPLKQFVSLKKGH